MQIVVLGDSIAQGLGVAGCSYADKTVQSLCAEWPEVQLTNFAASAAQISGSKTRLPEIIQLQPDVVIIAHGITEAIVRPVPDALRFVPRRWRRIGWLDPRPYFSRRLWKRLCQKTESAVRWRVKAHLINTCGGHTLTSADDFGSLLAETVDILLDQTASQIILLTHNGVNERFYPRSLASLNFYQRSVAQVAQNNLSSKRVYLCDVSCLLTPWSDYFADHFHPNAAGHIKIADAISSLIRSARKMPETANYGH